MSCIPKRMPSSTVSDGSHVLGLRGHVFGQHWGEPQGRKVNQHKIPDFNFDVKIRWKWPVESGITYAGHNEEEPLVLPHCTPWAMFGSDLNIVEANLGFPVRGHVKALISRNPSRKPIILEWGCGMGNAVKDLTNEPGIKGNALIFGYGDIWDLNWNTAEGVKFLFFVKEHLAEYLRRAGIQLDLIFTYGAMNYLVGEGLTTHLRDLATVMVPGAMLVIPPRTDILYDLISVDDIFTITLSPHHPEEPRSYTLTKK